MLRLFLCLLMSTQVIACASYIDDFKQLIGFSSAEISNVYVEHVVSFPKNTYQIHFDYEIDDYMANIGEYHCQIHFLNIDGEQFNFSTIDGAVSACNISKQHGEKSVTWTVAADEYKQGRLPEINYVISINHMINDKKICIAETRLKKLNY